MWHLVFILAFVFMITYDPKSKTLEKILPNAECREGHFQEVQFAQKGYECPQEDKTRMGAIIST